MITDPLSITQLAATANKLIALSPERYLLAGTFLLLLVISIPAALLFTQKKQFSVPGLIAYAVLVISTAVYYRVPFFPLTELNPDESLEIASAMTLLRDPVYWRSVDLGTHGPLATYPLMLPYLFGLQIDYGSARLLGLILLLASVGLIFSIFRKTVVNTVAVVAVLPVVTFICLTDYWDFVAYNAEHPVIFMVALSLFVTDKALQVEDRLASRYLFAAGVIVGSAPFVKIQSLPILFVIAASTCFLIWRQNRTVTERIQLTTFYTSGCLIFASLVAIYLWYFHLYDDFVMRYLYGQINYAKDTLTVLQKIRQFTETFTIANSASWYYFDLLIIADIMLAGILIVCRWRGLFSRRSEIRQKGEITSVDVAQLAVILSITAMSLLAVYVPGRPFRHYFLLLAFPLGILTGKLFLLTYRIAVENYLRQLCLAGFLLMTVFGQYYYKNFLSDYKKHVLNEKVTYELLTYNSIKNNAYTAGKDKIVTDILKEYAAPGEKMAVWGWADKYYIAPRLIIGCRTSIGQMVGPYGNNSYYLDSYLHEFKAARAPVFLDTVAQRQFTYTDKTKYGFEQFPQLNQYVQENYICVQNVNGIRIFVSKKRLSEKATKTYSGL